MSDLLVVPRRKTRWLILMAATLALLWCPAGRCSSAVAAAQIPGLEAQIVAATNVVRARYNLQVLRVSPNLTSAARQHSEEMLRLNYFSHESPTPGMNTFDQRIAETGVDPDEMGENLAEYKRYKFDAIARRVVPDWMNSPEHRENLMNRNYSEVGVAVASNGEKTFITMDLAAFESSN